MTDKRPIVAELGRPETPEETSARKAAASSAYRSSMNVRNLLVALGVTLVVVVIIVLGVPRGSIGDPEQIDIAEVAQNVRSSVDGPVLEPQFDDSWRVNDAKLEGGSTLVWNVTIAPAAADARGFLRIAQAFDSDVAWAAQPLAGATPDEQMRIAGLEWDAFELRGTSDANISYALGTPAGDDYILLYGALSSEDTVALAESIAPQIRELMEE